MSNLFDRILKLELKRVEINRSVYTNFNANEAHSQWPKERGK
jgi:hypothetical protein